MAPRYGQRYSAAVLRPFAEQAIGLLSPHEGDTALDVICDSGVMSEALARAVGARGRVFGVDTMVDLAEATAARSPGRMTGIESSSTGVPLADGSCDCVVSLFTLGFGDVGSLLDEMRRVARAGARAVALMWDPDNWPAHEAALYRAFQDTGGVRSTFLAHVLAGVPADRSASQVVLHDVVRFDGYDQGWSTLIDDRPQLRGELDRMPARARRAVAGEWRKSLQRFETADGTLRIPVSAVAISPALVAES